MKRLTGILPPITSPFDRRGDLDLGALAANVERYDRAGLAGYLAFGSNGEAVHLTYLAPMPTDEAPAPAIVELPPTVPRPEPAVETTVSLPESEAPVTALSRGALQRVEAKAATPGVAFERRGRHRKQVSVYSVDPSPSKP